MRLTARVRANRANAKRSTGPRSKEGKNRSAQNALKHGLSISSSLVPNLTPAIEAYVNQLVREGASTALRNAAIDFAEAQVDVDRVRTVRKSLYEDDDARTVKRPVTQQLKIINQFLDICERVEALPDGARPFHPYEEAAPAIAEFIKTFPIKPETPSLESGMGVLAPKLLKLWRYERRALSRREKAAKRYQALCLIEEIS